MKRVLSIARWCLHDPGAFLGECNTLQARQTCEGPRVETRAIELGPNPVCLYACMVLSQFPAGGPELRPCRSESLCHQVLERVVCGVVHFLDLKGLEY